MAQAFDFSGPFCSSSNTSHCAFPAFEYAPAPTICYRPPAPGPQCLEPTQGAKLLFPMTNVQDEVRAIHNIGINFPNIAIERLSRNALHKPSDRTRPHGHDSKSFKRGKQQLREEDKEKRTRQKTKTRPRRKTCYTRRFEI